MITQVREIVSKLRFVAPVAIHFLLVSCNSDVVSPRNSIHNEDVSSSSSNVKFTGEQLFRGIFFNQGVVAKELPIFAETLNSYGAKKATDSEIEAKRVFSNDIVEGVISLDVSYLPRLKKAVASGDPFVIRSVVQEGAVLLQKAGLASPKFGNAFSKATKALAKIDLAKFDTNTPEGRNALAVAIKNDPSTSSKLPDWLWVETAVVAVVAIGVYILVLAVVAIRHDGTLTNEGLGNDQLIAQIVQNLSPNYSK